MGISYKTMKFNKTNTICSFKSYIWTALTIIEERKMKPQETDEQVDARIFTPINNHLHTTNWPRSWCLKIWLSIFKGTGWSLSRMKERSYICDINISTTFFGKVVALGAAPPQVTLYVTLVNVPEKFEANTIFFMVFPNNRNSKNKTDFLYSSYMSSGKKIAFASIVKSVDYIAFTIIY